jgi:hypothetical protein
MELAVRTLACPKDGNSEAEYEDAYAVGGTQTTRTIAVADGASSSAFAGEWARLLADGFAADPTADPGDLVARLGAAWRQEIASGAAALPWYTEEKVARGAHGALLVVTFDLAARTFTARAVGDTCLFVVGPDGLRVAFPIERAADFDNRPELVATEDPFPAFARLNGAFAPIDRFLLMTDALAAWFLAETAAGGRPWREIPEDAADFRQWLGRLRSDGVLRNDDVTLVTATPVASPVGAAAAAASPETVESGA